MTKSTVICLEKQGFPLELVNMTTARKVAQNTIVQILGRVVGLAITLVTINYISNHLQVNGSSLTGFGQYTIVFAYVSIIGTAADLGLFTLLVRELVGKSKEEAGQLIGNALWFRCILLVVALAVAALLVQLLPYSPDIRQGIMIGVVIAFSMLFSQVFASIFQANLLSNRIVISETLGKLAIALLTIFVLMKGYGLTAVILANLAGNLITLFVSYLLARPLTTIKFRPDLTLWRRLLPEFLPIALISILGLAHFKIDTLLLSFLKPEADVGIYGLAFKILETILIVPSILAANLLPVMAGLAATNLGQLSQIVRRASLLMLVCAIPLTVFVLAFAETVIVFLSHGEFLPAVLPLRILSLSMVFVFISTLFAQAMIAAKMQRLIVPGYILSLVVNIGLNLFLIPRYSYNGAAIATLITEGILLLMISLATRRVFKEGYRISAAAKVVAAGLLTGLVTLWVVSALGSSLEGFSYDKLSQLGVIFAGIVGVSSVFLASLWAVFSGNLTDLKRLVWSR